MQPNSIINLGLFFLFPAACIFISDYKQIHNMVVKASPYVRNSLEYSMIYFFAFRGSNLFPSWKSYSSGVFKYIIGITSLNIIKELTFLNDANGKSIQFAIGESIQVFALQTLMEIGFSYFLMYSGYAKLSKVPFFLTAHLWVIFYASSHILHKDIMNTSNHFSNGFMIEPDMILGSMLGFTKATYELPMAIVFTGICTFNFELEFLIVSMVNNLLAAMVGYWTFFNHNHPFVLYAIEKLSPYITFHTSKLQSESTYLAICLILSIQIHFWWVLSKRLASIISSSIKFDIDPWTIRLVRTWRHPIHGLKDFVRNGILYSWVSKTRADDILVNFDENPVLPPEVSPLVQE